MVVQGGSERLEIDSPPVVVEPGVPIEIPDTGFAIWPTTPSAPYGWGSPFTSFLGTTLSAGDVGVEENFRASTPFSVVVNKSGHWTTLRGKERYSKIGIRSWIDPNHPRLAISWTGGIVYAWGTILAVTGDAIVAAGIHWTDELSGTLVIIVSDRYIFTGTVSIPWSGNEIVLTRRGRLPYSMFSDSSVMTLSADSLHIARFVYPSGFAQASAGHYQIASDFSGASLVGDLVTVEEARTGTDPEAEITTTCTYVVAAGFDGNTFTVAKNRITRNYTPGVQSIYSIGLPTVPNLTIRYATREVSVSPYTEIGVVCSATLIIGDHEISNHILFVEGGRTLGGWSYTEWSQTVVGGAWRDWHILNPYDPPIPDPTPEQDSAGNIVGWPVSGIVFGSAPAALVVSCVPAVTTRTISLVGLSRTYDSQVASADTPMSHVNEYWDAPTITGDEVETGFYRCEFVNNKLISAFAGISVSNGIDIIAGTVGSGAGRAIVSTIPNIKSVLSLPSGQACAGPWEDNVIWYGYLAAPKITLF
jgi:hypothetical protein